MRELDDETGIGLIEKRRQGFGKYDVVPKEEITEFEELMRKTIADIVSEASSVACWVYVQKYVKQKTLDEMLQELPGAGQFIIVMDTWFERLMAE